MKTFLLCIVVLALTIFDSVIAGGSDYNPRPKPGVCSQIIELKDKTGSYLKTACMISAGVTYTAAESKCLTNNMTLFTIENAAEQTALLDYSEKFFASYGDAKLWINGVKNSNGKWNSTYPTKPLFSGMKWISGTPKESGNCLVIIVTAINAPFYVQPQDCGTLHWSYCEYE